MEDKAKKKPGRRAYLDDFQPDATGEYVYTGVTYIYSEENEKSFHLATSGLWGCAMLLFLLSLAGGLVPASGALDCYYVVIPLVVEVIAAISTLWALIRFTAGGEELRAYLYNGSVEKLPVRSLICAIAAGAGFVGEIVYLLGNGFGGRMVFTLIYLLLKPLAAFLAVLLRRRAMAMKWKKSG